jgi:hypothetical protein
VTKNFITEITDFILQTFPTYKPWAEANAMFLVACANVNARLDTKRGPGLPITFDPWGIGPSRFGFKSTSLLDITETILKIAGFNIFPSRFSVEGYYKLIQNKGFTKGALMRDETTGLFMETRKNYLADEESFLCELLDGRLRGRVTVTHGEQFPSDLRVNFATCTTPQILSMLDTGFWVGGLGNRLIPIYFVFKERFGGAIPVQEEGFFEGKLSYFADKLVSMKDTNVEWVRMTEEVFKKTQLMEYTRRQQGLDDFLDDKLDIIPGWYYECNIFIQKIAALKAIDRQVGVKEPIVELEDYVWANQWIDDRYGEFRILLRDWQEIQLRTRIGAYLISDKEKILRKIVKFGELSDTKLNNMTHIPSEERQKLLEELVKEGHIKKDTIFSGGRPKNIWKVVESS